MTQIWFFGCCEAADILGFEFEMGLFPNVLDEARGKGIDIAYAESELGKKSGVGSKIVVEKGYIVKLSKDKKGIIQREQLTRHWTDWIDYWSVDFDFENKREIIRVKDLESGEIREEWTGDFIFENEWQESGAE
ncbi:hypothetical protein A9Q02_16075 [Candidatus Chloroploca asiatica]|uniref:Uncharacterized protein n=1 Tax=Candidatus Chloroploca asiatica TaxID=1506545 RepID=A0A2H3KK61_9CHLR|nr:hypothetical protein [Candidatus Chloroploca asiatica]PDV98317.1 hypothetical protein A9Q02_16075 [Candidatus Chloroploca asiatica]